MLIFSTVLAAALATPVFTMVKSMDERRRRYPRRLLVKFRSGEAKAINKAGLKIQLYDGLNMKILKKNGLGMAS